MNLSNPQIPLLGKTIVGKILERIAPRIGARIAFEPWGFAGQITFQSGRRAYFKGSSIGLNTIAAADIAKDKDFSYFFLESMNYRTIPSEKFFRDDWADVLNSTQRISAALDYCDRISYPLIVKPNSGSQGRGVAKVNNRIEAERAILAVFELDRIVLVQSFISGQDYRIVVLDNRIISAYRRTPLKVIGDGSASIDELIKLKQATFISVGRDTKIKVDDPRIDETLRCIGMDRYSIPVKDETVFLLSNANLSAGGDAEDVTKYVHPNLMKLCVDVTRDMGLRLCGVDVILQDNIDKPNTDYFLLEINAAPGLDHYAQIGSEQEQIVEALYLEVLESMDHEL
jgi:D-alanine-D-alanine ligase-like ATP-grasp enzyme